MIRQKHSKNSPHFNKQRIDLWALKKAIDGLNINHSRLVRRVENLQNLVYVLDEENGYLRDCVAELKGNKAEKKSFWQKVKEVWTSVDREPNEL